MEADDADDTNDTGDGTVVGLDAMAPLDPDDIEFGMVLQQDDFSDEFVPRLRNNGYRQHRRFTGYDQNLPMVIYGYRQETVHGTDSSGTTPLSLVVFRWQLQQRKPGHRFKSATLRAVFATKHRKRGHEDDPEEDNPPVDRYYDPHVVALAPSGTYALQPTVTDVTVARTRTIEGTAQVNAGTGPATAQLGGSVSYELSTTVTATDRVTINGFERKDDTSSRGLLAAAGDPDRCNVAEWQLFENQATRSGLPSQFCTAVLLERRLRDRAEFTVTFTIDTKVDSVTDKLTALKRFVGLVPRDDPIIFNPAMEEEGPLAAWKNKLDEKNLFDECKMVMYQSMAGTE